MSAKIDGWAVGKWIRLVTAGSASLTVTAFGINHAKEMDAPVH